MEKKSKDNIETKPLLDEAKENDVLSTLKGISMTVTMLVFIVLSSVCVQLLERSVPDLQLVAMRTLTALVVFTAWMIYSKRWPLVPREEIVGVAAYSLIGFNNTVTTYVGVTFLPLATAECIVITLNIFSGFVLFALVLKEKITCVTFVTNSLCITGVVLVIQPDFIFPPEGSTGCEYAHNCTTTDYQVTESNFWSIFKYFIPILCGTGLTVVTIIIKKKPYLSHDVTTVLFWTLTLHLILSLILTFTIEDPVLPTNWMNTIYVAGHSISLVIIWPTGLYAIKYISGTTYTLISSTNVVFMLAAQYTLLSSLLPGHRNWIEVTGVILVTMGSTLGSLFEVWQKQKAERLCDNT